MTRKNRIDRKKVIKEYNSVIIKKVQFNYNPKAENGNLYIHFNSGLIYEYYDVKSKFAEAFMNSTDRQIGTSYNKYINNYFKLDKIVRTEKFADMLEQSRERDKARKQKKKEKTNA